MEDGPDGIQNFKERILDNLEILAHAIEEYIFSVPHSIQKNDSELIKDITTLRELADDINKFVAQHNKAIHGHTNIIEQMFKYLVIVNAEVGLIFNRIECRQDAAAPSKAIH